MHGFAVLRGQRITGGAICIILTSRLARHFERHRLAPRNLGLPISQSVINRLRRRLDHRWMAETTAWWLARRQDLDVLDAAEFAARHGVAAGTAMVMRRRLCGARPDRLGWLTPEVAAAILAPRPARDTAAELGLSADRIYPLRRKLQDRDDRREVSRRFGSRRGPPLGISARMKSSASPLAAEIAHRLAIGLSHLGSVRRLREAERCTIVMRSN